VIGTNVFPQSIVRKESPVVKGDDKSTANGGRLVVNNATHMLGKRSLKVGRASKRDYAITCRTVFGLQSIMQRLGNNVAAKADLIGAVQLMDSPCKKHHTFQKNNSAETKRIFEDKTIVSEKSGKSTPKSCK
jgi:hypothetical protein